MIETCEFFFFFFKTEISTERVENFIINFFKFSRICTVT